MADNGVDDKALIQEQFGRNAANYTTSQVHAKGASLARLVELVKPQASWVALDVATGAGHTAAVFAPHVARVVASDLTAEMLVEARKLATEKGLANMEAAIADAEALPFADQSFDLVTCRIAPHHFGDVPRFVFEVLRVLKSGGVFALVDNVSPGPETTPGFVTEALEDAARRYNAFEKLRDPSHARALSSVEWRDIVSDQGFSIEAVEHHTKLMDFEGWCRTMSVPAATVVELEAMLHASPPALSHFLAPEIREGKLGFRLFELILIARRP